MIVRRIEPIKSLRLQRVAAYARVSTDQDEQQESFETQVKAYTNLIRQNPKWELVKVYADPGRSGTSAKKRPGFMEMISDAKEGKLDIILVKSISRFARNVVDAQTYVHQLKACDVEVRFEREALSSFDPSADMVFNLLSVVAQEESRSISENVKWSYRKLAEKGIRHIGNNRVLGYDEVNGVLTPNGDAWIVKRIFEEYANGASIKQIVQTLSAAGATRLHCEKPFNAAIIQYILKNEIYIGDRMLQKAAPHNYLTKKPDITQPYDSHYVKDDHNGIIDRDVWNKVQMRLEQTQDDRFSGINKRESAHFLYGIVFCSQCGTPYTRRTIRGKGGLQKIWKCAERLKGTRGNGCQGRVITEDALLRLVSDRLGLRWEGADRFDIDAFLATVKRIDVTENGIRIQRRKAA